MQANNLKNNLNNRYALTCPDNSGENIFTMKEIEAKLRRFIQDKKTEKKMTQKDLRCDIEILSTKKRGMKQGQFSEMLRGDRPFYFSYLCDILKKLEVAIYLDGENIYELTKNYEHAKIMGELDFYKSKYDALVQVLRTDETKKNHAIDKKKAK